MAKAIGLKCVKCGEVYPISAGPFVCPKCGERVVGPVRIVEGLLEVIYDYEKDPLTKEMVESRADRTIWKFRELLPVGDPKAIVSLGEGGTPLHRCKNLQSLWGVENLFLKNESMNPIGSFKDRETSVMLSMAKELGVDTVTITSSGNAGGAVAAYSNAAGINAVCFVPVSFNPSGKRSTYAAFNPDRLIAINGFYEDVNNVSIETGRKHGWYLTNHGFNPYRMEGDKTTAYEICMDLGWQVPDTVIVPTGSGGDLSGQWKAYKEMYDFGWIKALPQMIAVQMSAGAPLVDAVLNNRPNIEPILDAGDSIADGIISKWDDYAPLVLPAIRESKGTAVAVTDEETMEAERLLAQKEGIFLEPSSASAIAGYKKLLAQGDVDKEEVVVIIGTATGLKNPEVMLNDFRFPIEVEFGSDTISEVETFLKKEGIV
jgi:threonine synthase